MLDGEAQDPPKLTPKQETFLAEYLKTGNATAAYRKAYDCSKMKDTSVNREAHALLENPKIASRVLTLQARAADLAVLSRAWVLERLMKNAEAALMDKDYTASNKALELLGKVDKLGLFVERANVTSDNRHHHSAQPLSPFAAHLADVLGADAEGPAPGTLPH